MYFCNQKWLRKTLNEFGMVSFLLGKFEASMWAFRMAHLPLVHWNLPTTGNCGMVTNPACLTLTTDTFTGPEITIDANMVERFCAVVSNQDESFKTTRNVEVKVPMDFAIAIGSQVRH
jgi:hypothetical protein